MFSSTRSSMSSGDIMYWPCRIGTSRISMSQYLANLCHTTWTAPHTMFGLSAGLPSAARFARQRHLAAIPPSMHASEEPIAEAPTVLAASGAFQRSASMWTQRRSTSAVCGYSSLSIMFLSMASSINAWTCGSSQVWQNVARFWRALPSIRSSSDTTWKTAFGSVSSGGNRYFGSALAMSLRGEQRLVAPLPHLVVLMQRHGNHLSVIRSVVREGRRSIIRNG